MRIRGEGKKKGEVEGGWREEGRLRDVSRELGPTGQVVFSG